MASQVYSKTFLVGPRLLPLPQGSPPHDALRGLFAAFLAGLPPGAPGDLLFSWSGSPSTALTGCVRRACEAACVVAPLGASYSGHSGRGGCATTLWTLGASKEAIKAWCGWLTDESLNKYVNRLAVVTPAGIALLGFRVPGRW